jgi:hypothetical protein
VRLKSTTTNSLRNAITKLPTVIWFYFLIFDSKDVGLWSCSVSAGIDSSPCQRKAETLIGVLGTWDEQIEDESRQNGKVQYAPEHREPPPKSTVAFHFPGAEVIRNEERHLFPPSNQVRHLSFSNSPPRIKLLIAGRTQFLRFYI